VCYLLPTHAHDRLFAWISEGGARIFEVPAQAVSAIAALMRKYRDRLMDLADASLVWLAGEIGVTAVLTLDEGDFRSYRIPGGGRFELLLEVEPRRKPTRAKRGR
jgi:hypothetical protein